MDVGVFRELIKQKGAELFRPMPWRDDTRPYYVLVSEIMLQQTQVARVVTKFHEFINKFPDKNSLAGANLADVLKIWQGLGYNRRAKFLHEAAKEIVKLGYFPDTKEELKKLPGVGENTAGAVLAYSFNQPEIFVETNIRTVYLHHFFSGQTDVTDKEIRATLAETINHEQPREFYWALMDYGTYLKENGVKNIASSRHYKKQTPLAGSIRETRGQIIRALAEGNLSESLLREKVQADERFEQALEGLLKDKLIETKNHTYRLAK